MSSPTSKGTHLAYLKHTIKLAQKSPPKPTNFRVGCVIVSNRGPATPRAISTGYTLELEGNTHAEQCALRKLAVEHSVSEEELDGVLTAEVDATLYTSLEPCGKRLSGNLPCVQRIIATRRGAGAGGIRKVVFGAKEPGTFVQDSQSCKLLTEAGVQWEYIPDLEEQILKVAMEGHEKKSDEPAQPIQSSKEKGTAYSGPSQPPEKEVKIDEISDEERRRQQALPRNPLKRMMEAPPGSDAAQ